jgi:plastocyanin
MALEGRTLLGISRIALAFALMALVGVAGIAIYETSAPSPPSTASPSSSQRSSSGASLIIKMSPAVPLVAPGQTQNYTSIEISSQMGARLNGSLVVRAITPSGISMVLNETSVSLANDPQSIPFRLKADLGTLPGEYKASIETSSANVPALNQTFTIEVVPVLVIIQGLAFHPQNITISKGTSVSWINLDSNLGCCDPGNHNVVSLSGANASSPILKRLDTWSYKFDAVTTVEYACTIHPLMKGQITVSG